MNKKLNIKNLLLIAAALIAVGVIGSLVTRAFSSGDEALILERNFNVSQVASLDVSANNHRLEFIPTNGQEILVILNDSSRNSTLEAEINGETLNIVANQRSRSRINFGIRIHQALCLEIHLPREVFDTLNASTRNGRVIVNDVKVGELAVSTTNGRVDLNNIYSEQTTVSSRNGQVSLTNVEGTVNVTANNGRINLTDISGNVEARSHNGAINFTNPTLSQDVNLRTNNGRILISLLEEPTDVVFEASTSNGRIRIFGESLNHREVGRGTYLIRLNTSNGAITVE